MSSEGVPQASGPSLPRSASTDALWREVTDVVLAAAALPLEPRDAAGRDVAYARRHSGCSAAAACQPAMVAEHERLAVLGAWVRSRAAAAGALPVGQSVDVLTGAACVQWLASHDDVTVGAEWRRVSHDAVLRGHCFTE